MNLAVTVAFLVALSTAALLVLLFRKLASPSRLLDFNPDWLRHFSVARYRPMERLLSEEDYEFLATQRGYDPSIGKRLRSERRRIFRGYLRSLKKDFGRLEAALRLFVVNAAEDRPDLAKALLKQRLAFTVGVLAVECRLILHGLGIGTVDVRTLLDSLDSMRTQIGQLALARQPSPVA